MSARQSPDSTHRWGTSMTASPRACARGRGLPERRLECRIDAGAREVRDATERRDGHPGRAHTRAVGEGPGGRRRAIAHPWMVSVLDGADGDAPGAAEPRVAPAGDLGAGVP